MKKLFSFLLAVVILPMLSSCFFADNPLEDNESGNNGGSTAFNKPISSALVYTEAETEYVLNITDENTISLKSNTPSRLIPKVGTFILMPLSDNTPYGFLGKVISVEDNEDIIITTETVALDEVFPNLTIDEYFDVLGDIEGVFDEDGNPVEYTIEEADVEESAESRTRSAAEFDWDKKTLAIPIPTDLLGEEFSAKGTMKVSFAGSKIELDNKDELRYFNLELHPSISLSASITTKIKGFKKEFKTNPYKIKARAVVGPVIIPITIPIYFKAGIKGEISSTIQLNYSRACNAYLTYKDGDWSRGCEPIVSGDDNPWYVTSFDVNGSLYAGVDVEFIAGLYTTNIGAGFELYPNASLSANASLSSLNPFKVNPEVTFAIGLESRAFFMAKLFNSNLSKFDLKLPDVTFFKRSLSLFPNISNFDANGKVTSVDINYDNDSYYFLQAFNIVKVGATVYKDDKTTVVNTVYPAHSSIDNVGKRHYNTEVSGLQTGTTYYAAPIISCWEFKWPGDLIGFTTLKVETIGHKNVEKNSATVTCKYQNFKESNGTCGVEYWSGSEKFMAFATPTEGVNCDIPLADLKPGTTYNYRAFVNVSGNYTYAKETKQFKTKDDGLLSCPDANHPHWIDLGLPSGTQWRCCNEGASSPEAYGGYYTFGQVSTAPTLDQIEELFINTTDVWTQLNGVNGRKFTGSNGGTIFLPAAGDFGGVLNVGTYGYYWSSTPYDEYYAYYLRFNSSYAYWYGNYGDRFDGQSVRPVR